MDALILQQAFLWWLLRLWTASPSLRPPELPKSSSCSYCGELFHVSKESFLSSACCCTTEIALFLSSSVGYFSVNAECLFGKCHSTLLFLLFNSSSLHIRHKGNPTLLAVRAKIDIRAELNSLFSSSTFLSWTLFMDTVARVFKYRWQLEDEGYWCGCAYILIDKL